MIMIREYRKRAGMTMKELGDRVGCSEAAISLYELGKREAPYEILLQISEVLDTDVNHLLGRGKDEFYTFPVLGEVAAGYERFAEYESEYGNVTVPANWLKGRSGKDYFVLRVSGDSMFPTYQEGDLVLVLKQTTMNYSGQIGVVVYDDNKATLKKVEYVMGEDWMRLVPLNPQFPPIMVTDERLEHCRVLGIAKMVIREIH